MKKYIDVFEFWGPLEKQDFYYLIYSIVFPIKI